MNVDEFEAEIEAKYPRVLEVAHEVDPPYILALNVMRLRRERGLTYEELAGALGVSQSAIGRLEAGDTNPRLVTLSRIAHAFCVTLSELLTDHLNADRAERRRAFSAAKREP